LPILPGFALVPEDTTNGKTRTEADQNQQSTPSASVAGALRAGGRDRGCLTAAGARVAARTPMRMVPRANRDARHLCGGQLAASPPEGFGEHAEQILQAAAAAHFQRTKTSVTHE